MMKSMKLMSQDFPIGMPVRYRPAAGTYGYELAIEGDGRVPGVVAGYTPKRVLVRLTMGEFGHRLRAVDAVNLRAAASSGDGTP